MIFSTLIEELLSNLLNDKTCIMMAKQIGFLFFCG